MGGEKTYATSIDEKIQELHHQIFLELHQHGKHRHHRYSTGGSKSDQKKASSEGPLESSSERKRKSSNEHYLARDEIVNKSKRLRGQQDSCVATTSNIFVDCDIFESQKMYHNYLCLLGTLLVGPSGCMSKCKKMLQKVFLTTRKMRILHNELIRSIIQQALSDNVPLHYKCFIPPAWTNRIKILDESPKKIAPRNKNDISKSSEDTEIDGSSGQFPFPSCDTDFHLEDIFGSDSGCWQPLSNGDNFLYKNVKHSSRKEKSAISNHKPMQQQSSYVIESNENKNNEEIRKVLPPSYICGALDIDPKVRTICSSYGLEVSAHASWAIVIAVKQMVQMLCDGAQSHAMERLSLSEKNNKETNLQDVSSSSSMSHREHIIMKQQQEIHELSYKLRQQQEYQKQHGIDSFVQPLSTDALISSIISSNSNDVAMATKQSTSTDAAAAGANNTIIANRQRRGRGMKDLLALRTARSQQSLMSDGDGENEEATNKTSTGTEVSHTTMQNTQSINNTSSGSVTTDAKINIKAQDSMLQSGGTMSQLQNSSQQQVASSNTQSSSGGGGGIAVVRPAGRRIGMKDLAALRARKLSATGSATTTSTGETLSQATSMAAAQAMPGGMNATQGSRTVAITAPRSAPTSTTGAGINQNTSNRGGGGGG